MYDQKYAQVDLKKIDPSTIKTTEECDYLMLKLDQTIGDIADQVNSAKADAQAGIYSDPNWFWSAQRALKGAKATRQAVQARRGALTKVEREVRENRLEKAFIAYAREILPPEIYHQIWEKVRETP